MAAATRRTLAARTLVRRVVVAPADRRDRLKARHVADVHLALEHACDRAQQLGLVLRHQRNCFTGRTVAAGAADAVHVVLGDHRQVVVDDLGQLVDVDAARGDVGRHQHGDAAGLEVAQCAQALALALVAMDRRGLQPGLVQEHGQLVGTVLGAGEHQGLLARVGGQQVQQQFALARTVHRMHAVGDGVGHGVARGGLDFLRVVHELAGQLLDAFLEGGREQQGLPVLLGQLGEDALDRRQEAHVEHAVGFVQHQDLDARQVHAAALEVVEQAARAGDQQVHAAAQRVELVAHAHAAVDGGAGDAQVLAVAAQAVVDLGGQFAGRGQDQRARLARAGAHRLRRSAQVLQQRQAERGGLAGAGLRAGHQVMAFQGDGNGLRLDRGGGFVALLGQRAQQEGRKAQGFERHENAPDNAPTPGRTRRAGASR
ncbi:hypothetical protein NB723_000374 [Xanthomonas sacchari]|nr:hypothetical protein [Xanthomonas sacchari]